eukprot:3611922-Heterocapsa_arctica.AAC.1
MDDFSSTRCLRPLREALRPQSSRRSSTGPPNRFVLLELGTLLDRFAIGDHRHLLQYHWDEGVVTSMAMLRPSRRWVLA